MTANKIKYRGIIFAPLKNEKTLFPRTKDDRVHKSIIIEDEEKADSFVYGNVGQELNKKLDILIDTYEEEEIERENLDKARAIIQKGIESESDPVLVQMLKEIIRLIDFAKEKGTYVAFWL